MTNSCCFINQITVVREPIDIICGDPQPEIERPMIHCDCIIGMQTCIPWKLDQNIKTVPNSSEDFLCVLYQTRKVLHIDRYHTGRVLGRGKYPVVFHIKILHQASNSSEIDISWLKTDDCGGIFHQNIFGLKKKTLTVTAVENIS